ncbi:hypothetical protein OK016_29065 [Vibrio chagasii]|nr:hypothetical protein [Vibrio chagasii]
MQTGVSLVEVIETNVFNDQQISQKLKEWQTIKLDVTESSPEQMAWLNNKNIFWPTSYFLLLTPLTVRVRTSTPSHGDIDKAGFNQQAQTCQSSFSSSPRNGARQPNKLDRPLNNPKRPINDWAFLNLVC